MRTLLFILAVFLAGALSARPASGQTKAFYRTGVTVPLPNTEEPGSPSGVLTITSDGAAGNGINPHVRANGKTWVGWANDSGQFWIAEVDEETGALSQNLVASGHGSNRHMSPVTVVLDDGYLFTVYGAHTAAWSKLSTSPYDASSWESENTVGGDIKYPHVIVTDEGAGTERIYVFHTHGNGSGGRHGAYTYTEDRGQTWSAVQDLFTNGGQWVYISASDPSAATGRILVTFTDQNPNNGGGDADTFLMIYDPADGAWTAADGTTLTLPQSPSATTRIYDGGLNGGREVWSTTAYESLSAIYVAFTAGGGGTKQHHRAVWEGSSWDLQGLLPDVNVSFPGGIVMVDGDFDRLYAADEVGGVLDVYAFTTSDDGATWTKAENMTSGEMPASDPSETAFQVVGVRGGAYGAPLFTVARWDNPTESTWFGTLYLNSFSLEVTP